MTQEFGLPEFSAQLANIVERIGRGVVRVDDGARLSASGLIWSGDGIIVTTSHGVERDEDLKIELGDNRILPATLIGRDPDTDLAVLRVDATDLSAAPRAGNSGAKVGNLVLALGRPDFGPGGLQASFGIISARQDSENEGAAEHILHTDATLYPGFSGGALASANGEVIGLCNRGFGRGLGVALGLPIVERVAAQILAHGTVKRGYLGIGTQSVVLPESLQKSLQLQQARGLLIVGVQPGSPAENGGLLIGDVLLNVNDETTFDADELRRRLRNFSAGQTLKLRLVRGGAAQNVQIALGSLQ